MASFELIEVEGEPKANGSICRIGKLTVPEGVVYFVWERDHLQHDTYRMVGTATFPAKKPEE